MCAVCHTSHNTGSDGHDNGLGRSRWNHQMSSATHSLYSSPTLDAVPRQPEHFGSKLCLSCHDGTVALDSFGGKHGSEYIQAKKRHGTDLRTSHPIRIIYDSALAQADKGLHDPNLHRAANGGTINDDMLFGTGNLECVSCHDIHKRGSMGNQHLLRVTLRGSALCRTCHKH